MRLLTVVLLLAVPTVAFGGAAPLPAPFDFNYQGQLTDKAGNPLVGPVNLQIWIFPGCERPPFPEVLYVEDHPFVPLTNGTFNILLGSGRPRLGIFGPEIFRQTVPCLEVWVNGEPLSPPQPFSSTPYAFRANIADQATEADHASDADTIEGKTLAQIAASATGFRVQDGTGRELGVLVSVYELSKFLIFRPDLNLLFWLNSTDGLPPKFFGAVFYPADDCVGQAYIGAPAADLLINVDAASSLLFRGIAAAPTTLMIRSFHDSNGCRNVAAIEGDLIPAEPFTANLGFTFTVSLPIRLSPPAPPPGGP